VSEACEPTRGNMAKVLIFSSQPYVVAFMKEPMEKAFPGRVVFTEARLSAETATLAAGFEAVCNFVNDECGADVVEVLKKGGTKLVLQRCMGFDRVDLAACEAAGIKVARVPSYSPHSVSEHVVGLIMTLNRKLHLAHTRTRNGNFTLSGLTGIDLYGKTVGIVGTGQLGQRVAQKLSGFEVNYLCHDVYEADIMKTKFGAKYVSLEELFANSDIVTLHAPLMPSTHHMVNAELIAKAKPGMILINAARGGLVDTTALLAGLRGGQIGYYGMDVYEGEDVLFFQDFSALEMKKRMELWDTNMAALRSFPNVLMTPHSAFLTNEALKDIADTTILNFQEYCDGKDMTNEVKAKK